MDTIQDLFPQLGKLFYAIAASDNVVRNEERTTLRIILENEWKNTALLRNRDWELNAVDQIEMTFDWMEIYQPSPYAVFKEFKDFKRDNEDLFTPELKQLIWKTADGIASTFAGKNKSELVMLSKLKTIL